MKISIIDDHPLVGSALEALIQKKYHDTQFFHLHHADFHFDPLFNPCDIVILDLSFQGKSVGYEILEKCKHLSPYWIILSMHGEISYIEKALSLGANAYVLKSDHPNEILNAIEHALVSKQYLSTGIKEILELKPQSSQMMLTNREIEIAKLVIEGKSSKIIAGELGISFRTVDVHRQNIMRRLRVSNVAQLTNTLMREGLLEL